MIFKTSFKHLVDGVNLYGQYNEEYGDYYKYSPTFAALMMPFYYLPDWIGLVVWDLLNCILLYYGILHLPRLTAKSKFFILSFSFIELLTSLQNSQSNAMIAGLLLLAFVCMEKEKFPLATLLIMICFYIKLTGILACVLFYSMIKIEIHFVVGLLVCGTWRNTIGLYRSANINKPI